MLFKNIDNKGKGKMGRNFQMWKKIFGDKTVILPQSHYMYVQRIGDRNVRSGYLTLRKREKKSDLHLKGSKYRDHNRIRKLPSTTYLNDCIEKIRGMIYCINSHL